MWAFGAGLMAVEVLLVALGRGPATRLGRWAAGLIVGSGALFVVMDVLVRTGQRGGDTFFSNKPLAITVLAAFACGIAAFGAGLVAVVWQRERAVPVFVALVLGFFMLWFAVGEIVVPH